MKIKILIIAIAAMLLLTAAAIADWTPYGNINLRDTYNITNAPWINGTDFNASGSYYGSGAQLTGTPAYNSTYDAYVTANISNSTTYWDSETSQANLNVNSSNYWDSLNTPLATWTDTYNSTYDAFVIANVSNLSAYAQDLICTNCIGGTEISELADADVSDTLTCSDLVAGTSVVANSEVDDDITIDSSGSVDSLALSDGGTIGFDWVDAEVSDTLTCSDLVAGTSVVADAEVDNDLTIATDKWVNSTQGMHLADNDKFYFGTGDDVEMYYNASHFIIAG